MHRVAKLSTFVQSLYVSDLTFPHASGATKSVYAPEPFDVGRILQADIVLEGQQITLTTAGPIDPGLVLILTLHSFCLLFFFEFDYQLVRFRSLPLFKNFILIL